MTEIVLSVSIIKRRVDDGKVSLVKQTLEGADAERWNQACGSVATIAYVHGSRFPQLPWKTEILEEKSLDPTSATP